ncbi:MAG TPA: DNA repair protein RadA, partial [Candidatus Saccharimonadaceae bacterium]|nr:DNA repair protein RadA [Candidatus Saccharimonadaceae bacterium]
MVKTKTSFVCQNCGTVYPKWTGRCDNCGEWNTLVEQVQTQSSGKSAVARSSTSGHTLATQTMKSIAADKVVARFPTGFSELDEVLG